MSIVAHSKYMTFVIVLFAVSGLFFAGSVAQYVSSGPLDDLQARVDELKAIVADMQARATQEATTLFTDDLAYGDVGEDVRRLQRLLNEDPRTRVAQVGSGAPGSETTFFGVRTLEAVKRYQALYRAEILDPADVAAPTGYVGPSTRAHMNSTLRSRVTATETSDDGVSEEADIADFTEGLPEPEVNPEEVIDVMVSNLAPTRVAPGGRIVLTGYGFTEADNSVHLDDAYVISDLSSANRTRLSVPIPEDVLPGVYNIAVSNAHGSSSAYNFLIVSEGTNAPPRISHITPSEGPHGTEITIHGSGFTRSGNQIRASYAIIKDVPSPDGTTLTFKVTPQFGDLVLEEGEDLGLGHEIEFYFFVVNENGVSTQPTTFTWKI